MIGSHDGTAPCIARQPCSTARSHRSPAWARAASSGTRARATTVIRSTTSRRCKALVQDWQKIFRPADSADWVFCMFSWRRSSTAISRLINWPNSTKCWRRPPEPAWTGRPGADLRPAAGLCHGTGRLAPSDPPRDQAADRSAPENDRAGPDVPAQRPVLGAGMLGHRDRRRQDDAQLQQHRRRPAPDRR